MEQQLLIDPNDRQTAAYNARKYDKISINERIIITATITRDEALQVLSNLKSACNCTSSRTGAVSSFMIISA